MLVTLLAFLVAIGVLIVGHEWGHYRVAVACGVKVVRFSVGFGPVLLRWKPKRQHPGQDTEFVISAVPLGGYVKMLDEREAPVDPGERGRAYNNQRLGARALIAAAGPAANLVMAVLLYAVASWIGVQEPRALLSAPVAGSVAEQAGLHAGDLVRSGAFAGETPQPLVSFESLRWLLTRGALDGRDVTLEVAAHHRGTQTVTLPLSHLNIHDPTPEMFQAIGIVGPETRPVIGELVPGGAGARAGLKPGDRVIRIGQTRVTDGAQLRALIRASGADGAPAPEEWEIDRAGERITLTVQPDAHQADGVRSGRIGAYVGSAPEMVLVRSGPVEGLWQGAAKTWELSVLTLRVLGRMVVGQMSLKGLSGPVAIAEYAGQSARLGLAYYLGFLALISVSLGVLNLLPIPVLDGGHLMYFLWEAVTGRPVSVAWLMRLQYVGIVILLLFMTIAIYNDLVNFVGARLG